MVHVTSATRVVVVFTALFVEDPPTNGDFVVLVLHQDLLYALEL